MALGLKDLKSGRKKINTQNTTYKRKNLRPWESYNAFDSTKTQTIRAHEAVLKAQERLKEEKENNFFEEEKVRDDYFSDTVKLAPEEIIPNSSEFDLLAPIHPPFKEVDADLNEMTDLPLIEREKEKPFYFSNSGGLIHFIKHLFS